MTGIKVTLLQNGNLLFQANNETRADLSYALREGYQRAESDFVEMVRGQYVSPKHAPHSYNLEWLDPADIFALTEMPMLADTVRDDDDSTRVYGPVWGFPDYAIRCYLTELAHKGRVEFSQVADFGAGTVFPSRHSRDQKAEAERLAVNAYKNCINGAYVTEQVPDPHGEPGDTIARVVDIESRDARSPVVGDLFQSRSPI